MIKKLDPAAFGKLENCEHLALSTNLVKYCREPVVVIFLTCETIVVYFTNTHYCITMVAD